VGAAADTGVVTEQEATGWLRELEDRAASGDWFAVECMFVAVGTVPKRAEM
jgi:hypothetical protein